MHEQTSEGFLHDAFRVVAPDRTDSAIASIVEQKSSGTRYEFRPRIEIAESLRDFHYDLIPILYKAPLALAISRNSRSKSS